jgi:prepilin-type N-terminal cleavage/methylation domain-containing protein
MRSRKGFTLIELLIVVVIIGILAAIAVGKYNSVKDKAAVAVLRSDLKSLSIAEEAYYAEHTTYTGTLGAGEVNVTPSSGTVIEMQSWDVTGWAALATNPAALGAWPSRAFCVIYFGAEHAGGVWLTEDSPEGVPVCFPNESGMPF